MTSPIIDFIEARSKEDFEVATAAGAGRWVHEGRGRVYDDSADEYDPGIVTYDEGAPTQEQAVHIALHDPARVLREVAAKRAILAEHSTPHTLVDGFCTECGGFLPDGIHKRDRSYCEIHGWRECETVLQLAAIWSDHPDFDPNWSTT